MRGVYRANYQTGAITTAQTLLQITATASIAVEILSAYVTNTNNTTNQELECYLQRASAAGSTPTAITPAKSEVGDQAAASTVGGQPSMGEPTYTANTKLGLMGWASLAGYQFAPVPEERPLVPPSGILGLRLNTAGTSTIYDVELNFRELC